MGLALIGVSIGTAPTAQATGGAVVNIGDASVVEGNTPKGRTIAFPVTLAQQGTGSTVTVDYTVASVGSATAGVDYKPKTGTLKFRLATNGFTQVNTLAVVPLIGDTAVEGNETFEVHLSNPQGGGGFSIGRGVGTGTIIDDDPVSGVHMSVSDASTVEGDSGNYHRSMRFLVTLSEPSTTEVDVSWTTVDVTATCAKVYYGAPTVAGQDCGRPNAGVVKFKPSARTGFTAVSKAIGVPTFSDTDLEGDETFQVVLSNATPNATVDRAVGTGTILNDDA
jgi:hypothetical protein